tara:strand:- start:2422 stop:3495 length:1074 start_codon:yes stop_codon:yes gene_type:complete
LIKNKLYTKNAFFILSIITLCFLILLSFIIGPVTISLKQIFQILLDKMILNSNESSIVYNQIHETVIFNIRLPRIFLALLVGMGLGTSGAILQGLFRNFLVDPGFIGVSSGAAVGAMISIMFLNIISYYIPFLSIIYILPLLAMVGSFFATVLIYKISKIDNRTNIMVMLLSGIAINALAGSIIGLFVSMSSDAELRSFTFWTLGGLDNADWDIVFITSIFIILPLIAVYFMKKQLDIFMLGDAEANHLGIDIEMLKKKIILFSSIIVGISVSFCGMIGFIGLVTPHLVRLFIGPKHSTLLPGSALLGAILLLTSDLISKTIIAPAQLPIGVVTSAIGAPFFIWLIISQKRRFSYAE